jgi:adenylate kinase
VSERLAEGDVTNRGFLLDGFPRTPVQAKALAEAGVEADIFLLLNVPDEVLVGRVTGRRLDPPTGKIYHMEFNPPPPGEIADRVIQRADDTEEKLKPRLVSYHSNLAPIKELYATPCRLVFSLNASL